MNFHYGSPPQGDFASVVNAMPDSEFMKMSRSTVPLLAWWGDPEHVRSLLNLLRVSDAEQASVWFERPVPAACERCGSERGQGKASFTDVMVEAAGDVIAVEAKFTEKIYPSVAEWLGPIQTENKRRVLRHWLHCINDALTPSQVQDCIYQMVHRTASACSVASKIRARPQVVHLLFSDAHVSDYVREVERLERIVGSGVRFAVVLVRATPHADAESEFGEGCPDELREAVAEGQPVFTFKEPVIVYQSPLTFT